MAQLSVLAQAIEKSRADAKAMRLAQLHQVEKVLATRYIRDVVERDYEALCASRPNLPFPGEVCEYLECDEVKKSLVIWTVGLETILGDAPLIVSDFSGRITHILHPFKEAIP